MTELLKTYFERDLSPAEMDELGALIEGSPEAAMQLRENARDFYLGLGLPEPELPKRRGGWYLGAGGAVLLAAALWQGSGPSSAPRPSLAQPGGSFEVVQGPSTLAAAGDAPLQPRRGPAETGDYLSVELKRKSPAQVRVRILDDSGAERRRLYEGRLESGDWNFKWDGKLAGGLRAPAGAYVIEVSEDGRLRSKRVRLGAVE